MDGAGKVLVENCKVFDVAASFAASAGDAGGGGGSVAAAYEIRSCNARIKKCQVRPICMTVARALRLNTSHVTRHTSPVTPHTSHVTRHATQAISCSIGLLWGDGSYGGVIGCVLKNCDTGLKCAQVTSGSSSSSSSSAAAIVEEDKRDQGRKILKLNCEDCRTGNA